MFSNTAALKQYLEKLQAARSEQQLEQSQGGEESRPSTPQTEGSWNLRTHLENLKKQALLGSPAGASSPKPPVKRLPPIHTEVQKWFQTLESSHDGKINAKELQQAFEVFQNKHFSDGACKFVVRLFDLDKHGGLDVREFEQLYFYVKQWVNAFNAYDRDRSGFLDESELDAALKHMDINFTPEFIRFLVTRSDPTTKRISLDQFIITCVQIQRFTEEFKVRDDDYTGTINLKYEDFLEMVLRCL